MDGALKFLFRSRAAVCLLLVLWLTSGVSLTKAAAQTGTAPLRAASAIAFDATGNLFIADAAGNRVLEATLGGSLLVVAGTGVQGFAGDGGPATAAELNQPEGLAFGTDGTLYIADTGSERVRAIDSAGQIRTFAGSGSAGFSGDGGPALAARLREPWALAVDASGALLICDSENHRVRRVLAGTITTFAGTGVQGYSGDGGQAVSAELDVPSGIAVATDGRVFIADTHNNRVRVVSADGMIQSFAGTGVRGYGGDGGAAVAAMLSGPRGLVWSSGGALLIADAGNQRVRQIDAAGVISTWTGNGREGASLDGTAGLQAAVRSPRAIAVSAFGIPVLADTLNGTVRELASGALLYQPAALVSGRLSMVNATAPSMQTYGQTTVGVGVKGSVGVPQGAVQVAEGGTQLAQGTLANGTVQAALTSLSAGQHSLQVTYSGDGLNPAAASVPVAITVEPVPVSATFSAATVPYGAPIPSLSGVLAGVLPQDDGQVSAVFSVSAGQSPIVGVYPVAVSLTGPRAGNYTLSNDSATGTLAVVKAGTGVTLGDVPQSYAGVPVTLRATVLASTSGQPTGTVQFLNGTSLIATASVLAGTATATYTGVVGEADLSVAYLGDSNFLPSTSSPEIVQVRSTPDFTVASTGAQAASTPLGGSATYSLVVSSAGGPFSGAVSFSATGLPAGATVSFSPPQVVPGDASAVVTVAVQTASSSLSLANHKPFFPAGRSLRYTAFAGVLLCFRWGRRRRPPRLLLSTVLVVLTGCGARTVGEGTQGVLAQTYTVQVTGTATNLAGLVVAHSTPVTLTVQQ